MQPGRAIHRAGTESNIINKSKENSKLFWAHVRQKLKTKTGLAPLLENNADKNSTKFDDTEKANILQTQFQSVFTREPSGSIPSIPLRTTEVVNNLEISVKMILSELKKLNVNKSCGPDAVHPRMLKELAGLIAVPITFLLNKTLEKNEIPLDWKMAYVSPIFKKGARNRAENYRPIRLTAIQYARSWNVQ